MNFSNMDDFYINLLDASSNYIRILRAVTLRNMLLLHWILFVSYDSLTRSDNFYTS
jgi:hypothetical protein